MSLRSLMLLISAFSLIASAIVVGVLIWLTHGYIVGLLPDDVTASVSDGIFTALIIQALVLMIFALVLSAVSYVANVRFILRPLRKVIGAMQMFIKEGTLAPVEKTSGSPREVEELTEAFEEFTRRVDAAHQRDLEISRVKSDFISTAAHQLRTPLTGIRWALEALQKEQLPPDQKALIDSAVDKSHDLVAIIGTLLDIGSIESGKYKYKFEPVDMRELIEKMTQDFSPMAQMRQVSLYFVPSDVPIPKARADKERIKWVLNNLIENAIKYTPANGTVRVYMSTGLGRVFVHVKDTGIGISTNDRGNIFERFYRAPNAVSKENAGNGLGLYIARTIATDHGGDLNFEANQDGPGTTFSLALPVAN